MNAVITEIPALAHDAGVPPAPPEAHQQADDVRLIPLKRIVASPFNMRRKQPIGIEALADNIWHTGGLLQNLVVHPMKVGAKRAQTYGVAAGERRRRALALLAERGNIPDDYPVRCLVVSVEDAVLMSAAENEMREPPHPADQFEAFRVMVDAGRSVSEIAEIYGTSEQTVRRRLKLARVSPKLIELFRNDEIRIDVMQALAVSDSHDEQERAWFDAPDYDRGAATIRRKLVAGEHDFQSNRIALFVGIDAYEAAGGNVRRDLFSDQGTAWYSDHALMERVAADMLETVAATVRGEGWAWVKVIPVFDYATRATLQRLPATAAPPTDEQRQEMDAISARMDAIQAEQEDEEIDEATFERLGDEYAALEHRHVQIEESLQVYTPLQMATAGAVVSIDSHGAPTIERGWIKRGDTEHAQDGDLAADDGEDNDADDAASPLARNPAGSPAAAAPAAKGPHSAALTLRLNARRTASISLAIARQPHVALAALVHRFLVSEYAPGSGASAIDIQWRDNTSSVGRHAPELADDLPYRIATEQRGAWAGIIPNDTDALLAWCIEQPDERLLTILAQYVAASLDGLAPDEAPHCINALVPALGLNLADDWKPTRASYFDHVPKARIADVVTAAVSPAEGMRILKLKKDAAAAEAERLVSNTGWLPEHLAAAETRPRELWRKRRAEDDDAADSDATDATDAPDADPANADDRESDVGVVQATPDDANEQDETHHTERNPLADAEAEGMPALD
ncbi:ParB/RepB/Spo0J family partition protein [Burkholderia glumae]|uniref:ParB/RepB/Spo0J family partition protein n=1 Tax=Burkholderia glumae TaxID=337 RepID=UPI001570B910|nr:ParB N-terminal domain-containing protein [Burkholderia glumae]MCM2485686.1 ParB N-terminal domain-containing protein [Burkholderia glumae]MCM2511466.1 ParB N-terminal domain-containing protein [Burkholderia glumae]QKM57838.1 Chromosome-partitioning protein Spo0J [Burkholderia glumae]UVS99841.1 nuclease [Burkholderia glumae]UVT05827.1 nuclease [Burkholderia glumae]